MDETIKNKVNKKKNNCHNIPKEILIHISLILVVCISVLTSTIILLNSQNNKQSKDDRGKSGNATKGENWVILLANSAGYLNYRHQADIARAYFLLTTNGIKKENIITFAIDDIASSGYNPFPGQIFNQPCFNSPGIDFYHYLNGNIDYSHEKFTKENFLNALKGKVNLINKENKKILKSTENDNVFIFSSGHGSIGTLLFPHNELLYADELNEALLEIVDKKSFNKLVIYTEACHSGSMFTKIKKSEGIFAFTASDIQNPSYAAFCSPFDVVNKKEIGSCLGNLWSYQFFKGLTEVMNGQDYKRKIKDEVMRITKQVSISHPSVYGNSTISELTLMDFMGNKTKLNIKEYSEEKEVETSDEKILKFLNDFQYDFKVKDIKDSEYDLSDFSLKSSIKVEKSEVSDFYNFQLQKLQEEVEKMNKQQKKANYGMYSIFSSSSGLAKKERKVKEEIQKKEVFISEVSKEYNEKLEKRNKEKSFFEFFIKEIFNSCDLKILGEREVKTSEEFNEYINQVFNEETKNEYIYEIDYKCYRKFNEKFLDSSKLEVDEFLIKDFKYFAFICSEIKFSITDEIIKLNPNKDYLLNQIEKWFNQ